MVEFFEALFLAPLSIGCVVVFVHAAIYHFFEEHFNGVKFPGRYVLPTRAVVIAKIDNPLIRIFLRCLRALLVLAYLFGNCDFNRCATHYKTATDRTWFGPNVEIGESAANIRSVRNVSQTRPGDRACGECPESGLQPQNLGLRSNGRIGLTAAIGTGAASQPK